MRLTHCSKSLKIQYREVENYFGCFSKNCAFSILTYKGLTIIVKVTLSVLILYGSYSVFVRYVPLKRPAFIHRSITLCFIK